MQQQLNPADSLEHGEPRIEASSGPVQLDVALQHLVSGGSPKGGWETDVALETDLSPQGGW